MSHSCSPAGARRTILMGDPAWFSIKAGANPHTRSRWGWKKRVSRSKAIRQWHTLARTLAAHGVAIFVIPADARLPGLVYPANAGFLHPLNEPVPAGNKRFYLANLLPQRAGEKHIYRDFLTRLGFTTSELQSRFEGEADFFPAGNVYLFTYGRIERQRFRPRWGVPPYRRIYGFRSEHNALAELQHIVGDREILPLELIDDAYYHGDTVLCSFGPQRSFLLAYLEGLAPSSAERLRTIFTDRLIAVSRADAQLYVANSFPITVEERHYLFMPQGISEQLQAQVRDRGVEPVLIDVSEFLSKGGGAVKCMLCDLGPSVEDDLSREIQEFRRKHAYSAFALPNDRGL